MRRWTLVAPALLSAVALAAPAAPAEPAGIAAFYLSLRPGQCALGTLASTTKTLRVVPCKNPAHNFEVFATEHGGWGHQPASGAVAGARASVVCKAAFVRRTGHPIRRPYGWWAFWPDAGAEQNRYGDKIVCGLTLFPSLPLGAGSHIR